jgi:hypothetical protein
MFTKEQTRRAVQAVLARRPVTSIKARFWVDTIALVSAIACALALVLAVLGTFAGAAAGESESGQPRPSAIRVQTYEGMITDTRCGAKHSAAIGKTAADCTLVCVRGGEQFVLVAGEATYVLDGDPVALKRVAGQRVRIVGTLNGNKISNATVVTST